MKLIITHESFEQDTTPTALKEIAREHNPCGFAVPEYDELVPYLDSPEEFGDFVDQMSSNGDANADIFAEIENAANAMIGAGSDLLRILALWRGRYLLGEEASIIELHGFPAIGVMCADKTSVRVRFDDTLIIEPIANENAEVRAKDILRAVATIG